MDQGEEATLDIKLKAYIEEELAKYEELRTHIILEPNPLMNNC